ncbi:hypothetical protein Q5P01_000142 [Channa striata]|uniref:Uncharacterized protein n=1 Tax=Channa striata TaxID=64152 RepID=A0AA88IQV5_CHASR|nr:hypothetical protein Q5P01_000142 [Channa striata]
MELSGPTHNDPRVTAFMRRPRLKIKTDTGSDHRAAPGREEDETVERQHRSSERQTEGPRGRRAGPGELLRGLGACPTAFLCGSLRECRRAEPLVPLLSSAHGSASAGNLEPCGSVRLGSGGGGVGAGVPAGLLHAAHESPVDGAAGVRAWLRFYAASTCSSNSSLNVGGRSERPRD